MNFRHMKKNFKQYFIFYLIGFLIVLGLKYFYSKADSDDLIWILAPTSKLVGALSGIPFIRTTGVGYVNRELRFIIAPSCSGVQFMTICIATLIFSFVHRMGESDTVVRQSPAHKNLRCLGWIAASVTGSYLITILVNTMRIILSIYLPDLFRKLGMFGETLTPERLHTIIGTTVYFASLLTVYQMAGAVSLKLTSSLHQNQQESFGLLRKCLPPVFWYVFLVLVIPFLNGASRKNSSSFQEYAQLILLVCTAVLIAGSLIMWLKRRKNSGPAGKF